MTICHRILIVGVLVLLGACAAGGARVSTDYDPNEDFSALKRYAWLPVEQNQSQGEKSVSPLVHKRIREAVDSVLAQKGYKRMEKTTADFLVIYYVTVAQKTSGGSTYGSIGFSRYGRSGGAGVSVGVPLGGSRQYEEGTLIIDILDAGKNQLIWRGSTTRKITPRSSPAENREQISLIVGEILSRFPPKQRAQGKRP